MNDALGSRGKLPVEGPRSLQTLPDVVDGSLAGMRRHFKPHAGEQLRARGAHLKRHCLTKYGDAAQVRTMRIQHREAALLGLGVKRGSQECLDIHQQNHKLSKHLYHASRLRHHAWAGQLDLARGVAASQGCAPWP